MKYIIFSFFIFALLISCSQTESENPDIVSDRYQQYVEVGLEKRSMAAGIDAENDSLIIIDSFEEGDILYFSQLSSSIDPNFGSNPSEYPYQYQYTYTPNETANWYQQYNFAAQTREGMLDWDVVKSVGSVGNTFSLYAMYFPVRNIIRFNVETDQTGGESDEYDKSNFMMSDIMGAYHATSSLYTRLRFRLYHLMVYLKVTLYVPEYDDEYSEQSNYSGYQEGAMLGSFVMNALTRFNIEWRANRSSDTEAPLTQTNPQDSRSNIKMYQHVPDEETIINLPVDKFVSPQLLSTIEGLQADGTDKVREYNFSVLFPSQTFGDDFLCFVLKTPEGNRKYYYFSGSQIVGDSGNYSLSQGTLMHLFLYLPRKTNETILIGAKILPWENSVTDMTVTKKEQ